MSKMKEAFAPDVKPIATRHGVDYVTFKDQVEIAEHDIGNNVPLGIRTLNPDGSVARTPSKNLAVTEEGWFRNRYRKVRDKLYVVRDERAIMEQQKGRIYAKQIPCYVFSREKVDGEKGDLKFEKIVQISDNDFVADYTNTLNREAMEEILPLIENVGMERTTDELPI